MQGVFKCVALGKSEEKSKKSGKYHYLFVQGNQNSDGLFKTFVPIEFWSAENINIQVFEAYNLVLDIRGDFVNFIGFSV